LRPETAPSTVVGAGEIVSEQSATAIVALAGAAERTGGIEWHGGVFERSGEATTLSRRHFRHVAGDNSTTTATTVANLPHGINCQREEFCLATDPVRLGGFPL
jgi:hypothetical protein